MSLGVFLLAFLVPVSGVSQAAPGIQPDEVLTPPGGPQVVIFRSVPSEVVSLRVSVHLEEVPGEGGAGELIRIQAEDRMRVIADRVGARVEVHRTPRALVYQVSGTTTDLDFLGWILREGLKPPAAEDFEAARRRLRVESDRAMETPQGVLSLRIQRTLAPGVPSLYGSPDELDRMDPSRLVEIWERSHRREEARLVVAGRVPTELVLALTSDLRLSEGGAPADPPTPQDVQNRSPNPEVIRHWIATAYPLESWDDAVGLVVGRWLGEVVRIGQGDFELGAEVWEVGGRRALVLSGAAYTRGRQSMLNRVDTLLEDAVGSLTEEVVRRLSEELRTEILATSQTTWGLADLIGQAWDAGRGPEGLDSFLDELAGVQYDDVRRALEDAAGVSPIREQLNP